MAKEKSKGLGDDVEEVLEKTGAKKVAQFLFGKDCNCEQRKEWLNKKFPRRSTECLTQKEYKFLDELYQSKPRTIKADKSKEVYAIYNRVFNMKKKFSNCNSCVKGVLSELNIIYTKYKEDVLQKKN